MGFINEKETFEVYWSETTYFSVLANPKRFVKMYRQCTVTVSSDKQGILSS